ncbi:AAA family ATPase [Alicyclobacillus sp.]|uniref:AAA family ATPase n=1 Tax=Alicyclobacillus sp. TaxID=61169 RepID=UPI0025C205A7|nr:AAA family ATPase [Alicyclobacillus sp.]MCL6516529.1 AAA family ATPase [Alicyclobacillus sp.]
MRIRSIHVERVLHHDVFDLDFGDRPGGLHVLYGPNETGKSTLLQVMLDVLFGGNIEGAMKALYPTTQQRIGGVLERADGSRLVLQWKKYYSSLVLADGAQSGLTREHVAEWLCGYDRERFMLLFGFDHARLRAGGERLLQADGHAGVTLFEAGGGVQHLQRCLNELKARADDLCRPNFARNAAGQVNRAFRAYREAEAKVRAHAVKGEDWHRLRDETRSLQRDLDAWRAQRTALRREEARLQRVQRVRGVMARLDALAAQLAELSEAVVLTDEQDHRILLTLDRREALGREVDALLTDLARRHAEVDAMEVDTALLANREDVAALNERLAQYESFVRDDLPRLSAALDGHRREAESMLHSLAPDVPLDAAERLRLPFALGEEIQRLAERWRSARQAVAREREHVDDATEALAHVAEQIARVGPPRDVARLRDLVRRARREGNLEEEVRRRDRDVQARRQAIERLVQTQTVWPGPWEALAGLPVPLRETVERFERDWTAATRALETTASDLLRRREDLARVCGELEALEQAGHVPDEAELVASRHQRDERWRSIRRVWLHPEEAPSFGDPLEMADVYERAVAHADAVADRLRAESERVTRRDELMRQRRAREEAVREGEAAWQASREAFAQLEVRWAEVWRPAGITPLPPAEMKAWLAECWRPVREGMQELSHLLAERDALEGRRDGYIRDLADEMARLERMPRTAPASWAEWLEVCERCVQEEEDRQRMRLALEDRRQDAERQCATAQRRLRQAEAEEADVAAAWTALRQAHPSLPADPDIAAQYVSRVRAMFDHLDQARRVRAEIDLRLKTCRAFETDVRLLADRLGEPLVSEAECARWVREVDARLNDAAAKAARREQMLRDLAALEENLAQRRTEFSGVQEEIAAWMARFRCPDEDALRAVVERSKRRKHLEEERRREEQNARESGDGLEVDVLRAEMAEAGAAEEVQDRIDQILDETRALEARMEEAQRRLWACEQELAARDGSRADAADMAQQAEHHLAEVDRYWGEYLRVELARRLLERAIDEFRRKNQFRILEVAGTFFEQLTLGRYDRLLVDYEEDTPVLVARRRDGSTCRVHEMSDGTRDQLFLSLRLAFVEQHLETSEPLPLLMDDILVHFDDDRAQATMRVLQGLAERTQVIYFTHQRSVYAMALRMADSGLVRGYDLSGYRAPLPSETTA